MNAEPAQRPYKPLMAALLYRDAWLRAVERTTSTAAQRLMTSSALRHSVPPYRNVCNKTRCALSIFFFTKDCHWKPKISCTVCLRYVFSIIILSAPRSPKRHISFWFPLNICMLSGIVKFIKSFEIGYCYITKHKYIILTNLQAFLQIVMCFWKSELLLRARFGVSTAVFLRIHFFWDVSLYCLEDYCLTPQSLNMKPLLSL
jgi:hypothetical protein